MDVILVLNAGSSSLKFQIFALGPTGLERQVKDQIDGLAFSLRAVGHRVVHGGPDYAGPVRIDELVLERLRAFEALAPLHQPNNLAPIRLVREL